MRQITMDNANVYNKIRIACHRMCRQFSCHCRFVIPVIKIISSI